MTTPPDQNQPTNTPDTPKVDQPAPNPPQATQRPPRPAQSAPPSGPRSQPTPSVRPKGQPPQQMAQGGQPKQTRPQPSQSAPPKMSPSQQSGRGNAPKMSQAAPPGSGVSADEAEALRIAERAALRAERDRAMGKVPAATAAPVEAPKLPKRTTDKFFGSLGLFLLRLIAAFSLGIHGLQRLADMKGTQQVFSNTVLPAPVAFAWGVAIVEVLVAALLVFGFATRLAGFLMTVVAVGTLAFIQWGSWSIFVDGQTGFIGELDLLLAGIGLVLLCLGGGSWSIDGAVRRSRFKAKTQTAA